MTSACSVRRRRWVGAVIVLAGSAESAWGGPSKPSVVPSARLVVVDTEQLIQSSPATAPLHAKLEQKRRDLEQQLVPYAASFAPRPKPTDDAERIAWERADKKAFALRDKLTKQLEAYAKTLRKPIFAALAKTIAPKAKTSNVDYVLEINAVPILVSGVPSAQLDEAGPFSEGSVTSCRLVRVELEQVLRNTKLGQRQQEAAKKKRAGLEEKYRQDTRRLDFERDLAVRSDTSSFGAQVGELAKIGLDVTDRICVVEDKVVATGFAAAYERTKGALAKLPNSTKWVVANIDAWESIEARGGRLAVAEEQQRQDVVGEWVAAIGTDLAKRRGAAVPAPEGWKSAWTSTRPFGTMTDVVVGIDGDNKTRARVVVGRSLSLSDAEELRDEVRGDITRWTNNKPWQGTDIPEEMLADGYQQAYIWGKPADGQKDVNIWHSVEEMRKRGPGTILLTIVPSNDQSMVVLEFAQAALLPPVKPGIIPP